MKKGGRGGFFILGGEISRIHVWLACATKDLPHANSLKKFRFHQNLSAWPEARLREAIDRAGAGDVQRALGRELLHPEDLAALLSPAAAPFLEDMAQAAHHLTRQHFGRTIGLYAPIYLSNICHSDCTYCGFAVNSGSRGEKRTLTPAEIRNECAVLAGHGFQSVLLLTGEAPQAAPVSYLAQAVAIAREYFVSVAVEVYALDEADYRAPGGPGPGRGDPLHGDLPPGDLRRGAPPGPQTGLCLPPGGHESGRPGRGPPPQPRGAPGPLPLVGRRLLDGPARPPAPEGVLAERRVAVLPPAAPRARSASRWSISPPTGSWCS